MGLGLLLIPSGRLFLILFNLKFVSGLVFGYELMHLQTLLVL